MNGMQLFSTYAEVHVRLITVAIYSYFICNSNRPLVLSLRFINLLGLWCF